MHKVLKSFFGIVILSCVLSVAHAAQRNEAEAVKQAYFSWVKAVETARGNPEAIVKLYASDAILLATFSSILLFNTDDGLDEYFISFSKNDNLHCETNELLTKVYGNVALNTGLYTFTYTNDAGNPITVPARFTFIYEKVNDQWLIFNHHSSVIPNSH